MHTNPIVICFCSILYYRDLAEHIRRYKKEKHVIQNMVKIKDISTESGIRLFLKNFDGKIIREPFNEISTNEKTPVTVKKAKIYKKIVLNRWNLLLRLFLNKELIPYRGHNFKKTLTSNESISALTKIKLICSKKILK